MSSLDEKRRLALERLLREGESFKVSDLKEFYKNLLSDGILLNESTVKITTGGGRTKKDIVRDLAVALGGVVDGGSGGGTDAVAGASAGRTNAPSDVVVYWDFDNVPPPRRTAEAVAARPADGKWFTPLNIIVRMTAYLEVKGYCTPQPLLTLHIYFVSKHDYFPMTDQEMKTCRDLQADLHACTSRKEDADRQLITRWHADLRAKSPKKTLFVLIANDIDYCQPLRTCREHGFTTVVVHAAAAGSTHEEKLGLQATNVVTLSELLGPYDPRVPVSAAFASTTRAAEGGGAPLAINSPSALAIAGPMATRPIEQQPSPDVPHFCVWGCQSDQGEAVVFPTRAAMVVHALQECAKGPRNPTLARSEDLEAEMRHRQYAAHTGAVGTTGLIKTVLREKHRGTLAPDAEPACSIPFYNVPEHILRHLFPGVRVAYTTSKNPLFPDHDMAEELSILETSGSAAAGIFKCSPARYSVEQGPEAAPHLCVWCGRSCPTRADMVRHALVECEEGPRNSAASGPEALQDEINRRRPDRVEGYVRSCSKNCGTVQPAVGGAGYFFRGTFPVNALVSFLLKPDPMYPDTQMATDIRQIADAQSVAERDRQFGIVTRYDREKVCGELEPENGNGGTLLFFGPYEIGMRVSFLVKPNKKYPDRLMAVAVKPAADESAAQKVSLPAATAAVASPPPYGMRMPPEGCPPSYAPGVRPENVTWPLPAGSPMPPSPPPLPVAPLPPPAGAAFLASPSERTKGTVVFVNEALSTVSIRPDGRADPIDVGGVPFALRDRVRFDLRGNELFNLRALEIGTFVASARVVRDAPCQIVPIESTFPPWHIADFLPGERVLFELIPVEGGSSQLVARFVERLCYGKISNFANHCGGVVADFIPSPRSTVPSTSYLCFGAVFSVGDRVTFELIPNPRRLDDVMAEAVRLVPRSTGIIENVNTFGDGGVVAVDEPVAIKAHFRGIGFLVGERVAFSIVASQKEPAGVVIAERVERLQLSGGISVVAPASPASLPVGATVVGTVVDVYDDVDCGRVRPDGFPPDVALSYQGAALAMNERVTFKIAPHRSKPGVVVAENIAPFAPPSLPRGAGLPPPPAYKEPPPVYPSRVPAEVAGTRSAPLRRDLRGKVRMVNLEKGCGGILPDEHAASNTSQRISVFFLFYNNVYAVGDYVVYDEMENPRKANDIMATNVRKLPPRQ